ncbi:hypothetical protein KIN20_000066 [Parelaphostrongylus tenuis]|uniref:Uncharacterized protein n=1 Tax=Parelaphostrongylus tenuis TaxID=148309 RepID=A0AAD5LRL9_PARTN|nr:hypothetical protein KIN20_000066 [Parelaphostrongylus tenuis]
MSFLYICRRLCIRRSSRSELLVSQGMCIKSDKYQTEFSADIVGIPIQALVTACVGELLDGKLAACAQSLRFVQMSFAVVVEDSADEKHVTGLPGSVESKLCFCL